MTISASPGATRAGALAGLGFRVGYPRGGATAGVLAAVIGVGAIAGGKVAGLAWDIASPMGSLDVQVDREVLISYLADQVIEERRLAGREVVWPGGVRNRDAFERRDYPSDVWNEASKRWDAMGPLAKQEFAEDPEAGILDEVLVSYLADEIAHNWALEGKAVDWPQGAIPFDEFRRSWYPPDVWAEAEREWAALPESEKNAQRFAYTSGAMSLPDAIPAAFMMLPYTVDLFDALWVILGMGAAYKIASESEAGPEIGCCG